MTRLRRGRYHSTLTRRPSGAFADEWSKGRDQEELALVPCDGER